MSEYRLFFSHGGEDAFLAQALESDIRSSGAIVFLDNAELEYGDNFREKIFDELVKADELLVLLTESSIRRVWVIAELGATLIRDKRVVAIRYGPSEARLQKLGVLSLLGPNQLLSLNRPAIAKYVSELARRVKENRRGS